MRISTLLKYLFLFWLIVFGLEQLKFFMEKDYFKIMYIESTGDYTLTKRDIIDKVLMLRGTNIWFLNSEKLEAFLKKDVRLKNIQIEKNFPDTIKIKVEEREPEVYVVLNKSIYIADAEGVIYAYREEVPPRSLIVVDVNSEKEIKGVLDIISRTEGNFKKSISEVYRDEECLKFILQDGTIVKSSDEVTTKKYDIGYRLYTKVKEERESQQGKILYIDLRFDDYIVK